MSAERIKHLKLVIGAVDVTIPREAWPASGLNEGVPKGAVVEILGPQKFEWLISFLKQNPELKIFWAEKTQSVLPTALSQRGIDLSRVSFGVLGEDCFVSLRKIIQSQVYEVILAPNLFKDLKMFRAFQLLTEKANNTLFLAGNKTPSTAWPIALQLEIMRAKPDITKDKEKKFHIEVLKQKYGRTE
jgi:hypothetical protein